MQLRFLGKDSTPTNSPTLYATDNDSFILQGWIVTDPKVIGQLDITDEETIVEVPPGLMGFLAEDGLNGKVTSLVPPIVHVMPNGNLIVKGRRITDLEALGQMDIPDHETCVECARSAVAALVGG